MSLSPAAWADLTARAEIRDSASDVYRVIIPYFVTNSTFSFVVFVDADIDTVSTDSIVPASCSLSWWR
jgi:hypothetical protein